MGGRGGGLLVFNAALVLALVDRNGLVDEGNKDCGAADSGDCIFDVGLQSLVKQKTFCTVVKIQGGREGLEVDSVSCCRFGLTKLGELGFRDCLEIAVQVEVAEGNLEGWVIVAKGVVRLFGDVASPVKSWSAKQGDDKKNFLFVGRVGIGTHGESESTLSHEVAEF